MISIILQIFFSSIFIISYYTALPIENSYSIAKSLSNILETRPINYESLQYANITNKTHIDDFIYYVVLYQIYDDGLKEYSPMMNGSHYISNFNYFMGLRLTHNRVQFK